MRELRLIIGIVVILISTTTMYGLPPEVVPDHLDMMMKSTYVAYDTAIRDVHFEISEMRDWQKDATVDVLLNELKAPKLESRVQAAYRLGEQKALSAESINGLLSAIKDKSFLVRTNVIWALGKSKVQSEAVLTGLIGALTDKNEHVRLNATSALYGFGAGARKAIPELKKLMKDDNEFVREVAQVVSRHLEESTKQNRSK